MNILRNMIECEGLNCQTAVLTDHSFIGIKYRVEKNFCVNIKEIEGCEGKYMVLNK